MSVKQEIQEVKEICERLDEKNREYVLAVSRALQFAQEKEDTKKQIDLQHGKPKF